MIKQVKLSDYLFLFLVLLAGFWQIPAGVAVMKWDIIDLYLPNKDFVCDALLNGNLPLWNPFVNSGVPQMADPATWYPVSWLIGFLFRYKLAAVELEFLLHLYIAGLGMFLLGGSRGFSRVTGLFIATAYMLSGFFIGNAQHMTWIVSAAWLPWIFYLFSRLMREPGLQPALKFALVLFLMLSGGYPGIIISVAYMLAGWMIIRLVITISGKNYLRFRKQIVWLGVSAGVFVLLGIVVIYSTFDTAALLTRGQGLGPIGGKWGILEGSLPARAMISIVLPSATGINDREFWGTDFSMLNCYGGLLSFLLFLYINLRRNVDRRVRLYSLFALLFLMLSMGEVFPFRRWLLVLPYMDLFRFPALFRLFYILFMLLVAGYGLEYILESRRKRWGFYLLTLASALALIILIPFLVRSAGLEMFGTLVRDGPRRFLETAGMNERIILQAFVNLVLMLFLVYLMSPGKVRLSLLPWAFLLVLSADMILTVQQNSYSTVITHYPADIPGRAFRKLPSGYPRPSLEMPASEINDENLRHTMPYVWKNLGVLQKIPSSGGLNDFGFNRMSEAFKNGSYQSLIDNPLLFLATGIDGQGNVSGIREHSADLIRITGFDNNRISVNVTGSGSDYLVFLQNYHRDWKVTGAGNAATPRLVNGTFMAIRLAAGRQDVEFRFQPGTVIVLAWVSIGSWALVFLLLAVSGGRRGRKDPMAVAAVLLVFISALVFSLRRWVFTGDAAMEAIQAELAEYPGPLTVLNLDDPGRFIDLPEGSRQISMILKRDISRLTSILEDSERKTLFYASVNRPRIPLTEYILEDFYPRAVESRDFGNAFFRLASGSEPETSPGPESENGFEGPSRNWSGNSLLLDSMVAHSGKYSIRMDSSSLFSPTFRQTYDEFSGRTEEALLVRAFARCDSVTGAFLVLQATRGEETVAYHAGSFSDFYTGAGLWHRVYLLVPLEGLRKPDLVSIYVWNPGQDTFWLDDLVIRTY